MSEKLLNFYEFIYDRQEIWHNRYVKQLPRPWTKDPILNEFKFTEAYRENDRTTKYLIRRVIENSDLSNKQKVFAILLFRIFNLEGLFDCYFKEVPAVELFEALVRIKELDNAKASGKALFNNAYNITQRTYCSEHRKGEKHVQHLLNLESISKNWDNFYQKINCSRSAKDLFEAIKSLNFFGPFLAYQCMIDISYMNCFLNHDWNAFVYVGPGAKPTIEDIFGKQLNEGAYSEKCVTLYKEQDVWFTRLLETKGKNWQLVQYETPYAEWPYLSLNNIQSACCEYRKYCGYKLGFGVKRKFFKPKEK